MATWMDEEAEEMGQPGKSTTPKHGAGPGL